MSAFWSGWLSGIVILSLGALVWLLVSVWRGGGDAHPDAVWDGDLREVGNPAPLWWLLLMVALLAYSAVYLVLYPGLGNWSGALKWSQQGQLECRLHADEQRYGAVRARWRGATASELAADPQAMRSAAHLYQLHCATCHGIDARGQAQFPDLTDDAWQWGGLEMQIAASITNGRTAVMPPWGALLKDEGVAQMRDYLLALSEGGGDGDGGSSGGGDGSEAHAQARQQFAQFCAACHGADARGNPTLGAPDLTDAASLYGNTPAAIAHSITAGRTGVMPAWNTRLDETQIRLLAAWLVNGAPMDEN